MSDNRSPPEPSMDEILTSIRRILAEDEHAMTRPPPRARVNGDVLDLTEALNEDGTVRHIPPITLVTPDAPPWLPPDGRIEPVPSRPEAKGAAPRLVSDTASQAVAASFARLAARPRDGEREQ